MTAIHIIYVVFFSCVGATGRAPLQLQRPRTRDEISS